MTNEAALAAAMLSGFLYKDTATNEWVVSGGAHGIRGFRYSHWKPALVHWAYFHDRDWYEENWGQPQRDLGHYDRIAR